MTLTEAIAVLNGNRFWGYNTWQVEGRGKDTAVVPEPGAYGVFPEDAIKLAKKHPRDDGRSYITPCGYINDDR